MPDTQREGFAADTQPEREFTKRRELSAFLFLTVVLAPVVTLAVVGGYGFAVWMFQLIAGPPSYP